jgi:hypothetical protein
MRLLLFLSSTICLFPLALAPLSLAQTSPYPANATFFTGDPPSSVIITFAKPVPPGTTFTIALQTVRNPSLAGTYLFRVQAFPSGPEPVGFDLGVGRFTFYQRF